MIAAHFCDAVMMAWLRAVLSVGFGCRPRQALLCLQSVQPLHPRNTSIC